MKDVLQLVNGRVPLIIEMKHHENIKNVCSIADELIRDYKGVYCVESFHPLAVKWYRDHRPEVIRGQLSSNFRVVDKNPAPYSKDEQKTRYTLSHKTFKKALHGNVTDSTVTLALYESAVFLVGE